MNYTREQIKTAVQSKGFVWFDSPKDYDVNIVGVRNLKPGKKVTNEFDDVITVSYKVNGVWQYHEWKNTTDPGKKPTEILRQSKGVARLKPGQYRGIYAVSMHNGKYEALCQRLGNVTVYRDNNKDTVYDEKITETGMFGINIHRSSIHRDPTYVDYFSEGCQVFRYNANFIEFMKIINKAKAAFGNKFTYTLIESTDIK
jgi:hypothetical protein